MALLQKNSEKNILIQEGKKMDSQNDFEKDILEAEILNDLRKQFDEIRKNGFKGIKKDIDNYKNGAAGWTPPADTIEESELLYVLREENKIFNDLYKILGSKNKEHDFIINNPLNYLFKCKESNNDPAKEDNLPVLRAAVILQALSSNTEYILNKLALGCCFRIICELNRISQDADCLGGASSNSEDPQTAFVTWYCSNTLLTYAEKIKNTSNFIKEENDFNIIKKEIEKENKEINPEWEKIHNKNIEIDFKITKSVFSKKTIMKESATLKSINSIINSLIEDAKKAELDLKNNEATKVANPNTVNVQNFISKNANAFNKATKFFKELVKKLDSNMECEKKLDEIAKYIRDSLFHTKNYFQTVMEHELSKSNYQSHEVVDAAELIFAADGFARFDSDEQNLKNAMDKVLYYLTDTGHVPTFKEFTANNKGYNLRASGPEVIRCIAELARKINYSIKPDDYKKILRHFKESLSADDSGDSGWYLKHDTGNKKKVWWFSALHIIALDSIIQQLDNEINNKVFKNFSVKKSEDIKIKLKDLFYPDYGLIEKENIQIKKNNYFSEENESSRETESLFKNLQYLRAHINDVKDVKNEEGKKNKNDDIDIIYSIVLHGPPGTGKTTFVEALDAIGVTSQ